MNNSFVYFITFIEIKVAHGAVCVKTHQVIIEIKTDYLVFLKFRWSINFKVYNHVSQSDVAIGKFSSIFFYKSLNK